MMRPISRFGLRGVALLAVIGPGGPPAQATNFWKNSIVTGDWSTGSNWSATSAAGVDDAGAPTAGEAVNIVHTDGAARTVTYDVNAPTIGLLSINLMGGATTNTLSMPSGNNLTANGIYVGGYNGSGATTGRGAIDQTTGTVATGSNTDLVVSHGAGSTGVYTLSGGALVANQSEFIGFAGTGTFNHSAGTNTVNASAVGSLDLGGFSGATGTYNLSGAGALTVNAHEYVGDSGTGFFNHTGGTNTIVGAGRNLYLGFGATGIGEYVISGTATLSAGGNVIVGNNGTGALVIQDQASVFITNSLTINSAVNNLSTVNLNGGTLRFNTASGLNRLNYTAGTIQLAGNRGLDSDSTVTFLYGPFLAPPASISIPTGKALNVEGETFQAQSNRTVTVNGGSLSSTNHTIGIVVNGGGTLVVNNGGTVTTSANVTLGDVGGSSGTATVSGAGSTWSIGGSATIGGISTGAGTLNIQDQALVHVGSALSINNFSTVALNGGTLRFNTISGLNRLTYSSGTIQLAGNRGVGTDATITTLYGAIPTLSAGKGLTVEGTATLSKPLTIAGGAFKAASLAVGAGGSLNFDHGILELTGGSVTGLSNLIIPANGEFRASGAATTRITGAAGSTITATGGLTLGNATLPNGFYSNGDLVVGANIVTLADANEAVLDSAALVALGAGGSPGTLAAANGLTLDFGGNVTGFGAVDTPNSASKPFINNGHITGDSVAEPITLAGYVKGVGTLDNVVITGTDAPGFSPATVVRGSVDYDGALEIEIGGTTLGSFDQINHVLGAGTANLGGTLDVQMINSFQPTLGNSFEFLTALGGVSGVFDTPADALPQLSSGLKWAITYSTNNVVLQVVAANLAGDYNQNGMVDAADYTVWRDNFGRGTSLPNDDSPGVGPDDYDRWRAHFGQTADSGSGASANAAVPEPATFLMLMIGVAGWSLRRRRAAWKVPVTRQSVTPVNKPPFLRGPPVSKTHAFDGTSPVSRKLNSSPSLTFGGPSDHEITSSKERFAGEV